MSTRTCGNCQHIRPNDHTPRHTCAREELCVKGVLRDTKDVYPCVTVSTTMCFIRPDTPAEKCPLFLDDKQTNLPLETPPQASGIEDSDHTVHDPDTDTDTLNFEVEVYPPHIEGDLRQQGVKQVMTARVQNPHQGGGSLWYTVTFKKMTLQGASPFEYPFFQYAPRYYAPPVVPEQDITRKPPRLP